MNERYDINTWQVLIVETRMYDGGWLRHRKAEHHRPNECYTSALNRIAASWGEKPADMRLLVAF